MVKIYMHPSLARFTDNKQEIELTIEKVSDILPVLCQAYPALQSTLLDTQGALTPYVNIYINHTHLREYEAQQLLVVQDKIDVLTALVGG